MQGELKQLSTAYRPQHSYGSDRSSSSIYLRNMLFGLARSLARSFTALTVGDSSVWPCPRCFSSRGAALQRYVGQAACRRRRFHRRRRGEMERKGGRDGARAEARTRTLLPKLEGRVGLPTRSLTRPPNYLPSFPRSHAHIAHGDRAITSMSSLDAARLGLPGAPSLPSPLSKHLYGKKGDARIERWPGRKSTSWDVESGSW